MDDYQRGYRDGLNARNDEGINNIGKALSKIQKIETAVSDWFGMSISEIMIRRRLREIVYPRHIMSYLLYKHTTMGCQAIGRMLKQDHSTVLNAVSTIEDLLYSDPETRRIVYGILKTVRESEEETTEKQTA